MVTRQGKTKMILFDLLKIQIRGTIGWQAYQCQIQRTRLHARQ
jgi:hypothetical protein